MLKQIVFYLALIRFYMCNSNKNKEFNFEWFKKKKKKNRTIVYFTVDS